MTRGSVGATFVGNETRGFAAQPANAIEHANANVSRAMDPSSIISVKIP
jgi:hypothetical protein